ncbi:hypothetical protein RhiJN_28469 [Ceratobasidium sp. AG-Ba]|nr:hypothetical protein RhiJN_28469 [Ceratobasidium sp. AG-Ba]
MSYFRLERNPAQKSIWLLSGKTTQAADTIRTSADPDSLRQSGLSAVRGYLTFNPEDDVPRTLVLKDILEIYECLAKASNLYQLHRTNCRWFCHAFLECLRDCKPCFGGHWSPCVKENAKQNAQALQAKGQYLKEKHSSCCHITTAVSVLEGDVAIIKNQVTTMMNQVQTTQPVPTVPNSRVVYPTVAPGAAPPHPNLPPSNNIRYTSDDIRSHPLASGLPASIFPETTVGPERRHLPVHQQRQPVARNSLAPANFETHTPQEPFPNTTMSHSGYGSVYYEGYPPNLEPWDTYSYDRYMSNTFDQASYPGFAPERSFPAPPPRNHHPHYNGRPSPHLNGNFRSTQHVHHRQRPGPQQVTHLRGIPEGMPTEQNFQQQSHHGPVLGQQFQHHPGHGHRSVSTTDPAHRNTFVQNRVHPNTAYTQDPGANYPDLGYVNTPDL